MAPSSELENVTLMAMEQMLPYTVTDVIELGILGDRNLRQKRRRQRDREKAEVMSEAWV